MTRLIDMTGQKFGRLTVIGRSGAQGRHTAWLCRCDCGGENRYSEDESAAIEAALAAGKVTRIESGHWPDAGRQEVRRLKSPSVRAKLKLAEALQYQ